MSCDAPPTTCQNCRFSRPWPTKALTAKIKARPTQYASLKSLQCITTAVESIGEVGLGPKPNHELSVCSCGGCVNILQTSISSSLYTRTCTHRPISTPAVQNEPVLSFAPGSEERKSVIQVRAVPRGNLVPGSLNTPGESLGTRGYPLVFHLHKCL